MAKMDIFGELDTLEFGETGELGIVEPDFTGELGVVESGVTGEGRVVEMGGSDPALGEVEIAQGGAS